MTDTSNSKLNKTQIKKVLSVLLKNADRLIYDCEFISDDYSLIKYLSIIAQEEIAKSFILYLVIKNTLTWVEASRMIKDHKSKQLISYIINYLEPVFEEWHRRYSIENIGKSKDIPKDIVDAVNIIAFEKIQNINRIEWVYENDKVEKNVGRIADGKRDIEKQNALYVSFNAAMMITNDPLKIKKKMH